MDFRMEIEMVGAEGRVRSFGPPDAGFNATFDAAMYSLAYGQLSMLMELAEEYEADPYEDHLFEAFRREADRMLVAMYEGSKDLPPMENMLNKNDDEDFGGFL